MRCGPAAAIIGDAIAAWQSGSAEQRLASSTLLDALNNTDAVPYVHANPCAVTYP